MTGGIERFEVTGVTWTDDDGTTYRRTVRDGEIEDHNIKALREVATDGGEVDDDE